ncbi:MAG: phage portal protein [Phycisphaerae bacterium]
MLAAFKALMGVFQGMSADYKAAETNRNVRQPRGLPNSGASADWHYRRDRDLLIMMERCRHLDRDDGLIGQGVDRAVANTVQDGFALDPNTGDEKVNKDLSERWIDWSTDPRQVDLAAELNFHDMEEKVLRHRFIDGDHLALCNQSGALELVEAHRMRTPRSEQANIVHGVELGPDRKRVAFWLTRDEINPHSPHPKTTEMIRVPAYDGDLRVALQIYDPKRASQSRGVSVLTPVFDIIQMFDDTNFARLVQQRIISAVGLAVTRELGFEVPNDSNIGEESTEVGPDGKQRKITQMSPGAIYRGNPGEKLEVLSPNVPAPTYFDFAKMQLTIVSVNLGMPLQVLLLDPSQTNFSGWRGAIDQARMGFRRNQGWLRSKFHVPVYFWKVQQWMDEDPVLRRAAERSNIRIRKHRWNVPSWPYIEPLKDANADLVRLKNGLVSPRRLHAERGRDWDDVYDETIEDNARAIQAAMARAVQINDEGNPETIGWRDLLPKPAAEGAQSAPPNDDAPARKEDDAEDE